MSSRPATDVLTVEVNVRLQALVIPEAVGGYSIIVPALPGCVSQGETLEEVLVNVVEAAEGWLAAGHDHNKDEDLRTARGE
jgi:predicted RNase H-like HicB family nuclease